MNYLPMLLGIYKDSYLCKKFFIYEYYVPAMDKMIIKEAT